MSPTKDMNDHSGQAMFAVMDSEDGTRPTLVIGIPREAYNKMMEDGGAWQIDLDRAGLEMGLMLFACEDGPIGTAMMKAITGYRKEVDLTAERDLKEDNDDES